MKVAFNLLLILVASILCLFAVEGLTRLILDDGMLYELEMWKYAREVKVRDPRPDLGHRHRSKAEAQLMGVDMRTNPQGLRGPDIAEQATPGVARIAFVGDSTTLGWGVAEQDTFATRVIADLVKAGRKVDGFNLGVGNYNTLQELTLFREVGVPLKPDIIVLTYFINDAEPMPDYSDDSWLTRHSAAWVVLGYRLDSLFRQFGEAPDWKRYYRDLYRPKAPGWLQTQKALGDFAATARDIGAKIIVYHLPELRELRPYPFGDVTAKVQTVVEEDGMPFVDLLPTMENLDPPSLWVTVPDPHPNANAMAAVTRGMIPSLLPVLDELCRSKGKGC
jgi:GDSL-like lipase/acylhydrolase family protein